MTTMEQRIKSYLDSRFGRIDRILDEIQKTGRRLEDRMYVLETRADDMEAIRKEIGDTRDEINCAVATMNEFINIVGSQPHYELYFHISVIFRPNNRPANQHYLTVLKALNLANVCSYRQVCIPIAEIVGAKRGTGTPPAPRRARAN